MLEQQKKEVIQRYVDWITQQPEYKQQLEKVFEIYWDYYSEDPDGARKALEHFDGEQMKVVYHGSPETGYAASVRMKKDD